MTVNFYSSKRFYVEEILCARRTDGFIRLASPFLSDSYRWNRSIVGELYEGSWRDSGILTSILTSLHCQQWANRVSCFSFIIILQSRYQRFSRPMHLAPVKPTLEYGQKASSPYIRRDINLMKHIQRLVSRIVKGMSALPYEDQHRFERRRLHWDFILA